MSSYIESIEKLLAKLVKFPGIGRRSAERIVGYLIGSSYEEAKAIAQSILQLKEKVRFCSICNNLSEEELCSVCRDPKRNRHILCIVERPGDVASIEKTAAFHGVYHVLMGSIAPLEGRGPSDLKIDSLINRIRQEKIQEVIIATDSDTEGETTALYLSKIIKPTGVRLSRIGLGLPVGYNLEYADSATLSKALEARRDI
ncbi:MAG: recombination protein RecR [Candidatus Omnitrophota bacterium]|nr:MAG: recombination protein RecR [Candidatus Omnitrophota bacterium]